MTDRFEDLRTYVAVVETRGFNAAAERLGLAKSAVSRRIGELEQRLNARLITRTTRQLRVTEAGDAFYRNAVKVLEQLREAEEGVGEAARQAVGRLRVSAPVSFTIHCLAPVLCKFLAAHPKLTLEIETDDKIVDIVGEGFDLAIRISHLKDSTLIAKKITTIRHAACASPAYLAERGRPLKPADLTDHQGITYLYVDPRKSWRFREDDVGNPRSNLLLSNGDAMREAAVAGCGITVLPTFIVHKSVERGELEVLLTSFARDAMAMYAVFPSTRQLSAKVRLFVDFLSAEFGDEPFWDRNIAAAGRRTPDATERVSRRSRRGK